MTQICTTVEQSKTLVELGIDANTADMSWLSIYDEDHMMSDYRLDLLPYKFAGYAIPAWSLSALLDLLECPVLQKDKIGDGKEAWMVSCYPNGARVDSYWNESPIDACVKMIVKLKEDGFN